MFERLMAISILLDSAIVKLTSSPGLGFGVTVRAARSEFSKVRKAN